MMPVKMPTAPFARFAASAADEMACIASHVDPDSQFAFALSCGAARAAVAALAPPLAPPPRTRTTYAGVIAAASARLATWSVVDGRADVGALAHAAVWFDGPVGIDVLEVVGVDDARRDDLYAGRSRAGDVCALDWALSRGHEMAWPRDCVVAAAERGHIGVLDWIVNHGLKMDMPTAYENAVIGGHVALLDWLDDLYPLTDDLYRLLFRWDLTSHATRGGHVEVLEWLRDRGVLTRSPAMCTVACATGQLRTLAWLRAHRCPWNEEASAHAAANGHVDVLNWALENGCPVGADGELCSHAASSGHIAVLEALRARGYAANVQTCVDAVFARLDILQWLRANGCPWDARVCTTAYMTNHLATLKWAVANGCPWDAVACGGDAADCIRRLEQIGA